MRILFFLLLLANLVYLAWATWVAPGPSQSGFPVAASLDGGGLRLVSEAPGAVQQALAAASAAADAAAQLQSAGCVSIGPFVDAAEAERASARLASLGFQSRSRSAVDEAWVGHWVSVPDLATPEDAQNALAALRGQGLAEATVFGESAPANVVSLGVYTDRVRADEAVLAAGRAGYTAVISDRYRTGAVSWIDVDRQANGGLPRLEDLQASPTVRLELRVCPPAAAPATAPPAVAAPAADPVPASGGTPPAA